MSTSRQNGSSTNQPIAISLVAVGDELLDGRTTDRNATFLGQWCRKHGLNLAAVRVVPDDQARIVVAIRAAAKEVSLVIVCGGLGPTDDDRTRQAAAALVDRSLIPSEASLMRLREKFAARGLEMPAVNVRQTLFPDGARILPNAVGTADAFSLTVGAVGRDVLVVFLPGVRREFEHYITTLLSAWLPSSAPASFSTLQLVGITESAVAEKVEALRIGGGVKVTYCAHFPVVELEISSAAGGQDYVDAVRAANAALGPWALVPGATSPAEHVAAVLSTLRLRLATAESCTGGRIADQLTDVPGASRWFERGLVVYANDAKVAELGVPVEVLETHGAVSEETVAAMARGLRERTGVDAALAVSGIAGPDGGSDDKPVGTVHLAVDYRGSLVLVHAQLPAVGRDRFKSMAAALAQMLVARVVADETDDLRRFLGVKSVKVL